MPRAGLLRTLILKLLAALAVLVALPAPVQAREIAASCLAFPIGGETLEDLNSRAGAWLCESRTWSTRPDRVLLQLDLGEGGKVPERLVTRIARFDALRVGIERHNGRVLWTDHRIEDFVSYGHMQIAMPMPAHGTLARRVFVEIRKPTMVGQLSMTKLVEEEGLGFGIDELYLAALCGLLIAPLLFNLAFYGVLRERFLLWHALVVLCMLGQVIVTSGLIRALGGLPMGAVFFLMVMTFSGGMAAALMLATHFIERDRLDERHRQAMRLTAAWIMFSAANYVVLADHVHAVAVPLFVLSWIPVFGVVCWTLHAAARNGSRAVWFQIAAWAPMMLVGLVREAMMLIGAGETLLLYRAQDLAIAVEVIVISIGIIDRFVSLRRDLDRQLRKVNRLEELAERDPLTGLLNRRAIEARFSDLRREGFATLAVLDLDLFKDINDRFGHGTGDRVLQSVARALAASDDLISVRLGGEEFVLLLRGRNAAQHAEWCRKAITTRIAAEVDGLDRLVTASMGLLEIPSDVMPNATFAALFSRADSLLYQAKRGGRNRMVSERLSSFKSHLKSKPSIAA